jgi:hypothetical protein
MTRHKLTDAIERAYTWPDETITLYVGRQSLDHRTDCRGQWLSVRAGGVPYWPHVAVLSVRWSPETDTLKVWAA